MFAVCVHTQFALHFFSLSRISIPALFGGLIMFTQLLSEISSIGVKKRRKVENRQVEN